MWYGWRQSGSYERHVDVVGREGGHGAIEVVPQTDVDVAHLTFRGLLVAPFRERFEELFDGYEEAGDGCFDGGLGGR